MTMASFGQKSMYQLTTCDHRLQNLMLRVVQTYDCSIIQGHRPEAEQLERYNSGASKVKFGNHCYSPSKAVDAGPWLPGRGIPWPQVGSETYIKDLAQFYHFAGYVQAVAAEMGINIRWGGDWDRDHDLADQSFDDLVHFELVE